MKIAQILITSALFIAAFSSEIANVFDYKGGRKNISKLKAAQL